MELPRAQIYYDEYEVCDFVAALLRPEDPTWTFDRAVTAMMEWEDGIWSGTVYSIDGESAARHPDVLKILQTFNGALGVPPDTKQEFQRAW